MTTLNIDPEFQALIPPLSTDELAQLEASILAEGCRDALVVWRGENVLIDGHNRYDICQKRGTPFKTVERDFADRNDVILWIIQNQLARRNLTAFARGELSLRMKEVIAAKAKANQGKRTDLFQNFGKGEPLHTDKELSKNAGVSHETIRKIEAVTEHAPEPIKQAAREGELSVDRAYKLTKALESVAPEIANAAIHYKLTDPQLIRLLDEKKTSETVREVLACGYLQYEGDGDSRDKPLNAETTAWDLQGLLRYKEQEYRRRASDERLQAKFAVVQSLPDTVFSVVYADPAWQYDNTGLYGAAERHYPTMPTGDICGLLKSLEMQLTENAALFLWATNPLLPDALRVIEAWGFEYKTNFVWVKDKPTTGLGFYARGHHELLMLATRGSFLPNYRFTTLIQSEKGAHSAKPVSTYAMIETMYPNQHYVELFARHPEPREGWTFWGNQAHDEPTAA